MSRTIKANDSKCQNVTWVADGVFRTPFFFQNVLPVLISKEAALHKSFRNILLLIDIMQWMSLHYHHVSIQILQINTSQSCAFLFALTQKFGKNPELSWFARLLLQEKIVCALIKRHLFLQPLYSFEITATLLDFATTFPPQFVFSWTPHCQKWFCPLLESSQETKYSLYNSSVIRQKGESQNRCFKKTKHVKFPEKRTFLTPWYA